MSADTPRTDELATFRPNDDGKTDFVLAEFARELERENARLRQAAQVSVGKLRDVLLNVRDHRCLAVAVFLAWSEATAGSMTLVGIRWIALLGLSPLEWAAIGFALGYGVLMLGYWTKRLISFNRSKTQVRQKHPPNIGKL